jgi:mRNA interferase MazF
MRRSCGSGGCSKPRPTPRSFAVRSSCSKNLFFERNFVGNSAKLPAASDHPPSRRCRTWIIWQATASKMPDRSPRRGELWAADLNPRRGSEPGKVRSVVIVQSDLLNETDHPSTWILPCTTRLSGENVLRVELPIRMAGNARVCEVMIDQSRAIDRRRLVRPIGRLPQTVMKEVAEKLRRVGDL